MILFVAVNSLVHAQDITIAKVSDKKFEVINGRDSSVNLAVEVWMDDKYLGKTQFDSIPSNTSMISNIDDWEFVQKDKKEVFIEKIRQWTYEPGEQLPNSEIENVFLTYQYTEHGCTLWRIYLEH